MTSAGTRIAAMTLLLACAVTFGLVSSRDPGYARLRLDGGTAKPAAHRDVATFTVQAAPFSLIELSINGRRAASAYVPWNAREVRFERTPLDDGRNVVVARTTLWYAASQRTHAAELRVDNPPQPLAGRARETGARGSVPGFRNGRMLALELRQQEIAAAFAVRLPRSDPAVRALRAARIDLRSFVDDVFGAPRLGREPISDLFTGAHARFEAAGDALNVSAESGFQPVQLEDLPAFAGEVEIANVFGPTIRVGGSSGADRTADTRRWADDVLRLHAGDYRFVDCAPPPLRREAAGCIWDRPFERARTPVVVSLEFAPFSSIGALRRGLNLPVFAFAPHAAARFLAFFHGFVLAIPMFAYLVLSRGRNPRLAVVARRLIAVAVAADVFDACISAQPDVDGEIRLMIPAMRALPPALVNLFVVPALIGLVLAFVAASLAQLASRARSVAGTIFRDATNAVKIAAVAFVAIAATSYAAGALALLPVVYPALVAAALAAGLLGVLVAVDWWSIPSAGRRRAFTIATLAFAAAVAVPLSLVQFGAWAAIPERAGTAFADPISPLALTASFLRSLAPLSPLAFALLLIAAVRPDPAALGLEPARIIRLALCCYGVLAGVIVIVPVGFVLAWWTYDLLRARDGRAASEPGALVPPARERGHAAIPLALAFVLIDVLLLLPSESRHLRELHTPFVVLEAAGFLAVVVASFVIPAFAFAAWSDELAGKSGLRKGVNVALWVIGCSLPAWLLRSDSFVTAVAVAIVSGLFYAVLGRFTTSGAIHREARSLGATPRPT